ncbi:MAG: tRNA (guanine(46)-N(7))-methyltransferase TrmB, partial [Candidatus Binataceae bacterium]
IELAASVARLMAARAGRRGLTNVRVAQADSRAAVNLLLPDRSVAVYHIYFPDPWPKPRHQKHRVLTPAVVASLARTLSPGGVIHIASDVREWAREMFAMLSAGGFAELKNEASGAGFSGFGRKYTAAGRPIFSATFGKQGAISRHVRI